jgi:iron complex transport system ATP-binding protein
MNLVEFKERNYLTLSGGEKQRVQYARVLAQVWEKPTDGYRYLFLDEPLNSLDIKYRMNFCKSAVELMNRNTTVLIARVMHRYYLAAPLCRQFIFF